MLEIDANGKNAQDVKLTFTGDLSVSTIAEVYEQLKGVSRTAGQYHLAIHDIENLDLSFFQLLYAFLLEVKEARVNLEWDLPEESLHIMKETGMQTVFDELIRN
jgi:ABC-type transporter Mla MlaB component